MAFVRGQGIFKKILPDRNPREAYRLASGGGILKFDLRRAAPGSGFREMRPGGFMLTPCGGGEPVRNRGEEVDRWKRLVARDSKQALEGWGNWSLKR